MLFKTVCVFLDLSPMDDMLIRYGSFLADLLKTEKIYFIHVFESTEIPEEISKLYPELSQPLDKIIEEELSEQVDTHFSAKSCLTEIKVNKGEAIQELLEWAQSEEIDLMVLGKKPSIKGTGILTRKIAKLSYCSVLLLPEMANTEVNKILVPIDFSKYSRVAFRQAKHIAEIREAYLICQHVYKLPNQFFPFVSAIDKKLKESTEKYVKKEMDDFLKKLKLNDGKVYCEALIDKNGDVARTIYEYAVENAIDLIVLGPKGNSYVEYFLMGSVCEKLINYGNNIKILIAKDKKEHESLFSEIYG